MEIDIYKLTVKPINAEGKWVGHIFDGFTRFRERREAYVYAKTKEEVEKKVQEVLENSKKFNRNKDGYMY